MAPTILFVPGFWEGPTVFEQVSTLLQSEGFATETAVLASTGHKSPNNPTMEDDIAAIRAHVAALVEADKDVVLVLHSGAGFLGSNAIENLEASKRQAAGKKGGVSKIVFLAAGIFPEGFVHGPLPFAQVNDDGGMTCVTPEQLLFHDVPDKERWLAVTEPQPAHGWDGTVTYCGWRHVPSVYVVATQDQVIPAALQPHLAATASSEIKEVEAGHMLQLSKPQEVADIIKAATA